MMAGAHLAPVPVDHEGLNVAEGIRRARSAHAVYITRSHQYPFGVTMTATRRMLLLHWAARSGAWIIEDDYDSEYRLGGRPIASLQGLDTDARVIYVGTFSKVMFSSVAPGLRGRSQGLAGRIFHPARRYRPILIYFVSGRDDGFHPRRTFTFAECACSLCSDERRWSKRFTNGWVTRL